jgi:hypothetical protein
MMSELRAMIERQVRTEIFDKIAETNKLANVGAKVRQQLQPRRLKACGPDNRVPLWAPHQAFPPTKTLPESQRMRIVVTGGAGFVGSNLVDRLMEQVGHMGYLSRFELPDCPT